MKPPAVTRLAAGLAGIIVLLAGLNRAQDSPRPTQSPEVHYIVSLAGWPEHMVRVKIILAPGNSDRDLQLPVWNALYQIRDFAQWVNLVRARGHSGQPLAVQKVNKSRWHITGAEGGAEIEYEIFADQTGPFGAQLNSRHAFLNPAEILMYPADGRASRVQLAFADLPRGWKIATPLTHSPAGDFTAENYDHLADSPVEIGAFEESDFDEGGSHYRVVVDADPSDYKMPEIVSTLRRLVSAATNWMDDWPFQSYMFIYHFPRGAGGGGMEHAYSTAIDVSASRLAENPEVLGDLTAHEFFHLWNVKRIRPQSLEPIDYTQENYTSALWFSEGVTSTAGNIVRLRAGLLDEPRYLAEIAGEIAELERRPAHLTQSVEESSRDAWLEKYPYYRLPARSISYYNKGNLLGVLLDLQMRQDSNGSASIRDVFHWMNENYARKGQFFPETEGVRTAAEAVSHADLEWFFRKYVAGTGEIPWDDFFRSVGLHLERTISSTPDPGFIVARNFDSPLQVSAVTSGSAAEKAGLAVGDAILEIDGEKADDAFSRRSAAMRPGETLRLRVRNSRGDRDLQWTLGAQQEIEMNLINLDKVTPAQKARRAAWLKGEDQPAGAARP